MRASWYRSEVTGVNDNVLRKAKRIMASFKSIAQEKGRFILLCGDGVWELIIPQEGHDLVNEPSLEKCMAASFAKESVWLCTWPDKH